VVRPLYKLDLVNFQDEHGPSTSWVGLSRFSRWPWSVHLMGWT